ncbi:MAG: glutamate--tRNA ligase, partial [Nanoarchaeota archaeon]|nr:glutamate--tRNA ligase [Nanoarchaeota archaeon]
MKSFEKEIRVYALRNAIEHGEAVVGKVLPKLFNHGLDKKDISKVMPELNKIISEVNGMSDSNRENEFEKLKSLIPEREVKEKSLPDFSGKVVMRFEPSPSGPLHVGHSYVLALNSELVRKHNGKFILRIGDTNPENIYEPAYKLIPEDTDWLTKGNVSEVIVQSDSLEKYYQYFEKFIDIGKAYVCSCDPEAYRKGIGHGKACDRR